LTHHYLIDISEEGLSHIEVIRLVPILVPVKYLLQAIQHRVEPSWLAIVSSTGQLLEKNLEIVLNVTFKEVSGSLVQMSELLLIEDLQEFILTRSTNSHEKVQ